MSPSPTLSLSDSRRRFVSALSARDLVREVAHVLSNIGAPVMPDKGALLLPTVYPENKPRRITDVDVLVPEAMLDPAARHLVAHGFRLSSQSPARNFTVCLTNGKHGLPLDLHGRLFPRGFFHLTTSSVFARSSSDQDLYGAAVRIPHPHDIYAHLVGHFAKGRLTAERDPEHLADFALVAKAHGLDPHRVASHLVQHGLSRAAQYVLTLAWTARGDTFARDVLSMLPHDWVGKGIAGIVRPILARVDYDSPLAAFVPHLLNASLWSASYSLGSYAWDRARRSST